MVSATPRHAVKLARQLRDPDRAEIAVLGIEPVDVILESIRISAFADAIYIAGDLIGIYGIAPMKPDSGDGVKRGVLWLLTTDAIERYPKTFHQWAKHWLRQHLDEWDELINTIDTRHEKAMRWCQRLGVRFTEPLEVPGTGVRFAPFTLTKEDFHG